MSQQLELDPAALATAPAVPKADQPPPDKDYLLKHFVRIDYPPEPSFWQVGGVGRRAGQIGVNVAIIGFRHDPGYEVILRFPDGKLDSFTAHDLYPARTPA